MLLEEENMLPKVFGKSVTSVTLLEENRIGSEFEGVTHQVTQM